MAKPKPKAKQEVASAPEQDELGVDDPATDAEVGVVESSEEGVADDAEGIAEPEPEHAQGASEPSMDELYARATELKIKGRRLMHRAGLIQAIAAAEADGSLPEVDEPGGPTEPEPEGAAPQVATSEQAQRIIAATTGQLEGAIEDAVWKEKFPHLVTLVVQELQRRAEALAAANSLEARRGPMERYVVTKGGRYITRDGFPTHLAEGSLVTPLTHDLPDVAKQGIEFRPATIVGVRLDEMGRQISEVR